MPTPSLHDPDLDPSTKIPLILDWLSDHFHGLADEGQTIVDDYWLNLRRLENQSGFYQRATLGLRMRIRTNLALSLEWYFMGTLGRAKRPIAKIHIPKGRNRDSYPVKALMRRQPAFLLELVDQTETQLTALRRRHSRLLKIRDGLGEFLKVLGHDGMTGSRLMEIHTEQSIPGSPLDHPGNVIRHAERLQ
jgi:MobI protein